MNYYYYTYLPECLQSHPQPQHYTSLCFPSVCHSSSPQQSTRYVRLAMHVCLHHHHLEYLLILSRDVCDILSFELPSKHIHIQLDPHCVSEWSKPILVQLFIESCSSCPYQ